MDFFLITKKKGLFEENFNSKKEFRYFFLPLLLTKKIYDNFTNEFPQKHLHKLFKNFLNRPIFVEFFVILIPKKKIIIKKKVKRLRLKLYSNDLKIRLIKRAAYQILGGKNDTTLLLLHLQNFFVDNKYQSVFSKKVKSYNNLNENKKNFFYFSNYFSSFENEFTKKHLKNNYKKKKTFKKDFFIDVEKKFESLFKRTGHFFFNYVSRNERSHFSLFISKKIQVFGDCLIKNKNIGWNHRYFKQSPWLISMIKIKEKKKAAVKNFYRIKNIFSDYKFPRYEFGPFFKKKKKKLDTIAKKMFDRYGLWGEGFFF